MSNGDRYFVSPAGRGAWNMALDEALMAGARSGLVTLRFYSWIPACLSLGRNQVARDRYDSGEARRRGIDIVRRPTGGRAVLHRRELTYSVAAPAGLWGGLRDGYARINRALGRGLLQLGVPLDRTSVGDGRRSASSAPPPLARACFRDPLPGELTSGGRKLVGSAQWRFDGALLQHGSILLEDDQSVVDELLLEPPRNSAPGGACSIQELLGRVPTADAMVEALLAGFDEEFGLRPAQDEPAQAERREAERLERRYADPAWTWRR